MTHKKFTAKPTNQPDQCYVVNRRGTYFVAGLNAEDRQMFDNGTNTLQGVILDHFDQSTRANTSRFMLALHSSDLLGTVDVNNYTFFAFRFGNTLVFIGEGDCDIETGSLLDFEAEEIAHWVEMVDQRKLSQPSSVEVLKDLMAYCQRVKPRFMRKVPQRYLA